MRAFLGAVAFADFSKHDGFEIDKILHVDGATSDLHYHLYVPDSYDGAEPYAFYISLPGYGGYYFQGAGTNLCNERFATEAKKYNPKMIIAAPQPNDWGQNSKRQIIALTEHLLKQFNVDLEKVYISGYSGGGETLSLVVAERPDLFTSALHVSSRWDGGFDRIVAEMTPIYFVIGEEDEYYSSRPASDAYGTLRAAYKKAGLSDRRIATLAVLDIKSGSYFAERDTTNQHGGGALFAYDETVMGWLFGER
ncbi:MAG: alpha/beta hydrolase [Spirochaetae bacterium HGW-Spirochaetae-3]|nr:MAG: alpha/beta hydrolase [Spirochaetae bacterium HGW-Spirochaetae-3]